MHIMAVFGKKWRRNHDLIACVQNRLEHAVERACRPHGHTNILRAHLDSLLFRGFPRHCFSRFHIPRVRHITVSTRTFVRRNAFNRAQNLLGRLKVWVSQAKIKHVVRAVLRFQRISFLKHFPDDRRRLAVHRFLNIICYRHSQNYITKRIFFH